MLPYINIFGSQFPTYSLCAMFGLLVTTPVFLSSLYSRRCIGDFKAIFPFAFPGIIIGAKLFSVISQIILNLYNGNAFKVVDIIEHSGLVYYGGLLGFLTSLLLICKISKRDFRKLSDPLAISLPIFHSFGRIGCFFGGCCYGIESSSWLSIPYRVNESSEFISRIPVQLIESCFELVLGIILCFLFWTSRDHKTKNQRLLLLYIIFYSIFRFVIEFFRGDYIRGVYGLLSFSQIISIILLLWAICYSSLIAITKT